MSLNEKHPARFRCTKTYSHDLGLTTVFRQHRAKSHCSKLHGYALGFTFEFGCHNLDENEWVVDFGSLKPLKEWLSRMFDHTMVVAEDDPERPTFEMIADRGLVVLHVVPRVGCEAFAKAAWERSDAIVDEITNGRAWCTSCKVSEHGANSATYFR
jgi:6-pyruvoyltetrahydropterin/6-carboxytetrahydropterin synthase